MARESVTRYIPLLILSAFLTGCEPEQREKGYSDQKPPNSATVVEPWMTKPPAEWPQLVLTNHADFKGHTPLEGASSFLVRTDDGRILAATAKHLIGDSGGVEPEIQVSNLNEAIQTWRMHPRTLPSQFVEIEKVAGVLPEYSDWLVMAVKNPKDVLPATPMRLRREPVAIGDEVFLIGCPYSEIECKQNVYKGKVTARNHDKFRFDVSPAVELPGFSGAPIIDKNGQVVGVTTVWFNPRMEGNKYLEVGGEDAAVAYQRIVGVP